MDRYPQVGAARRNAVHLLELAGEDDPFARQEAAAVASRVAPLAPGLAVARGLDGERVRGLAYTRRASDLLGYADATVESARCLLETASIGRRGTVAVRARDVRGRTGIDTPRAERELGAVLVERGFAVDLDAPDHELRAVFAAPSDRSTNDGSSDTKPTAETSASGAVVDEGLNDTGCSDTDSTGENGTQGVCALAWLVAESSRTFGERMPTEKPFFQPGAMDPLLARAVANVAGAGPGRTIVDPMCGTGGILVEAGLVGSNTVGLDAQTKMVRGARTNLTRYLGASGPDGNGRGDENGDESDDDGKGRESEFAVIRGDATRVPLRDGIADGICFDVPYGRQSKIAGDLGSLVRSALAEAYRLAPRTVVVGDRPWTGAAREAGWEVESTFERWVHRSLTRHIAVLERASPA
jgi:tRNA (guanine10-N2)-dimethyltransferase